MPAEKADSLDLTRRARVHIVGIGGAGMSGLGILLAQMGHEVSGSDLYARPSFAALAAAGVTTYIGHAAEYVAGVDWLTMSPAVPETNPELCAARENSVRVVRRPEVMAALAMGRRTVAVAGTHGKTTTSAMLSLMALEDDPGASFLLGAEVDALGGSARFGTGDVLVVEADESYGAFEDLVAWLVGITNVEVDHLDHYGTLEALEAAFVELAARAVTSVVVADDEGAARVGAVSNARLVGEAEDCTYRIGALDVGRASSTFTLTTPGGLLALKVGVPGRHNVANAALAAALGDLAGLAPASIEAGLARFTGVPRRFEFRGEAHGICFVDDYAHLPAEVAATLGAAKAGGYERVVAVFQPHRFTRTAVVGAQFEGAFDLADLVFVTDIYSAGEDPIPGVTGALVASAVARTLPEGAVRSIASRDALADALVAELRPGDLCLTMGAGDLTELPDVLLGRLR